MIIWMRHWNTMVVLIAAASMTAVLADNVSTAACLHVFSGNPPQEMNLFTAWLISHWGLGLIMAANSTWAGVVIVWMCQRAVERRSRLALWVHPRVERRGRDKEMGAVHRR